MKKFRKALAVMLCLVMTFSLFSICASAEKGGTIKILSYNVAGLPIDIDVPLKQSEIGKYINASDYDIVALQEDFTFHNFLEEEITTFPYQTVHTGGIPGGDGMNIFSKKPIYNETRVEWETLSGVIDGGSDELTPKGFIYSVIELEEGVYLDFYVIHADAYGDAGSVAARKDNFRQLKEHINARTVDRPVIVAGDYNAFLHLHKEGDGNPIFEHLIDGAGLKDGWVECHNWGKYDDFSYYIDKYGPGYESTCGVWDSIERVMYKDGGGVELEITELTYDALTGATGDLSDHPALNLEFTYTVTGDQEQGELDVTEEVKNQNIFRFVITLIKDLFKLLTDWDKLTELVGGLFNK